MLEIPRVYTYIHIVHLHILYVKHLILFAISPYICVSYTKHV